MRSSIFFALINKNLPKSSIGIDQPFFWGNFSFILLFAVTGFPEFPGFSGFSCYSCFSASLVSSSSCFFCFSCSFCSFCFPTLPASFSPFAFQLFLLLLLLLFLLLFSRLCQGCSCAQNTEERLINSFFADLSVMNGIQDSLPGRMKISGHEENIYACLKGGHFSL